MCHVRSSRDLTIAIYIWSLLLLHLSWSVGSKACSSIFPNQLGWGYCAGSWLHRGIMMSFVDLLSLIKIDFQPFTKEFAKHEILADLERLCLNKVPTKMVFESFWPSHTIFNNQLAHLAQHIVNLNVFLVLLAKFFHCNFVSINKLICSQIDLFDCTIKLLYLWSWHPRPSCKLLLILLTRANVRLSADIWTKTHISERVWLHWGRLCLFGWLIIRNSSSPFISMVFQMTLLLLSLNWGSLRNESFGR